ncbi:MAG: 3-beta hydroxysteroid dehydrogenase, partial [Planctomycetota bacterium]
AAHISAARSLRLDSPHAGRAYFIGQERPVRLWDWIDSLLRALDIPPVQRRVPFALAYAAGTLCEALWWLARLAGEPPMTRFVALQLARSHFYSMEPAQRDFGFREPLSLEAATVRLVASLRSASEPT